MKKFIFTIITAVVVLTIADYYSAFIGVASKDEAILIIDAEMLTVFPPVRKST